jgi:hypothetical protein
MRRIMSGEHGKCHITELILWVDYELDKVEASLK